VTIDTPFKDARKLAYLNAEGAHKPLISPVKDRRSNAMSLPSEPRQAWADQRAEGLFLKTDAALGAAEEAETIQRGG
jgi:hypothetical protein